MATGIRILLYLDDWLLFGPTKNVLSLKYKEKLFFAKAAIMDPKALMCGTPVRFTHGRIILIYAIM